MSIRYQGRRLDKSTWLVVRFDDAAGTESELSACRDASFPYEEPICWGPLSSPDARARLASAILRDAMLPWHRGNEVADEIVNVSEALGDEWEIARDDIRRELTKRFLRAAIALAESQGITPEDL